MLREDRNERRSRSLLLPFSAMLSGEPSDPVYKRFDRKRGIDIACSVNKTVDARNPLLGRQCLMQSAFAIHLQKAKSMASTLLLKVCLPFDFASPIALTHLYFYKLHSQFP